MAERITEIEISKIVVDEAIYPRIQYAWQTAYGYSQAIKAGAKFPQIVLGRYKGKLYLVDGLHRINAYKLLKKEKIPAEIRKYTSRQEMFYDALRYNNIAAKPLTFEDKAKCFGILKGFSTPDQEIEKLLYVPIDKFNTLASRQQSTENGKVVTLPNVVSHAVEKEQITEEEAYRIVNSTPRKDLMTQSALRSLEDIITLFENNLVPLNDQRVIDKCTELDGIIQSKLAKPEAIPA